MSWDDLVIECEWDRAQREERERILRKLRRKVGAIRRHANEHDKRAEATRNEAEELEARAAASVCRGIALDLELWIKATWKGGAKG